MIDATQTTPADGSSPARAPGAGLSQLQRWILSQVLARDDGDAWGVPWRLDSPTRSESAANSTALRRLERRGLVERKNQRGPKNRATHVRLTDSGRNLAQELETTVNIERRGAC
jgi:hypothetical protein